jgi:hypothetical protein
LKENSHDIAVYPELVDYLTILPIHFVNLNARPIVCLLLSTTRSYTYQLVKTLGQDLKTSKDPSNSGSCTLWDLTGLGLFGCLVPLLCGHGLETGSSFLPSSSQGQSCVQGSRSVLWQRTRDLLTMVLSVILGLLVAMLLFVCSFCNTGIWT